MDKIRRMLSRHIKVFRSVRYRTEIPNATPWFWAINGPAGVLAAAIAVLVSVHLRISAMLCGAVCYLLLAPFAVYLA